MIFRCQSPLQLLSAFKLGTLQPLMLILLLTLVASLSQANTHCMAMIAAPHHSASVEEGIAEGSPEHDSTAFTQHNCLHGSPLYGGAFFELSQGCHDPFGGTDCMAGCSGGVCDSEKNCLSAPQLSPTLMLAEWRLRPAWVPAPLDSTLLQAAELTHQVLNNTANCGAVSLISAEFSSPPLYYRLCVMRL